MTASNYQSVRFLHDVDMDPMCGTESDVYSRDDSRFAPSQWETALLCNDVSHWLGASLESALYRGLLQDRGSLLVLIISSCPALILAWYLPSHMGEGLPIEVIPSGYRPAACVIQSQLYHTTRRMGWWVVTSDDKARNIERHRVNTIVSWPNPKQWIKVHTSNLMMIIKQSICILSIITREMGKLKTHSSIYCIMDNWENMLYLTHTLDKIFLTGIL